MLALMFQVGDDQLALDVRRVRQVIPRVPLSQPSGGPPWLAGVLIYRGAPLPVVDLFRLYGVGQCPVRLSSRIIVVSAPEAAPGDGLIGLLATEVSDLRELPAPAPPDRPASAAEQPCDRSPAPTSPPTARLLADHGELIRLLDINQLIASLRGAERFGAVAR